MKKLLIIHNSLVNKIRLRWASHYSRVTGKPEPSGYTFAFYDSFTQLPKDDWDNANCNGNIFLSGAYLSALEQAPPQNMKFRYVIISKENSPVGIAYFQILELNHRLHRPPLQLLGTKKRSLIHDIHDKIADTATFRLLVCGNALLSGEHGFSLPNVPMDSALQVIAEIAHQIRKSSNTHISVTLIKDLNGQATLKNALSRFGYYAFDAGPNMIVPIRNSWTTFDKYLNEMKSKYRKRATSAIKRGSSLVRKSFSFEELVQYRDELFTLYCQVVDRAKFKTFVLSPDFFSELKRRLGETFVCEGYFVNEKMVGFTTRIFNGSVMEGYSHGLSYERNKEYELYQNFLLDDIRCAITKQSAYVNSGRTSVAMKSSIGAIPGELTCYMRFSGKLSNQFIKPLFSFIKPTNEYCRNPFEDS